MGFLNRANDVVRQQEATEAAKPRRGGGGDKIGDLWLNEGDAASIRLVEQPEVVTDAGQLVRMGNPCCVQVVKTWKNGKLENAYVNPVTFSGADLVEEARSAWFKRAKSDLPPGERVQAKDCPIPRSQDRYFAWGVVCAFQCGPHTAESVAEKKLGFKIVEMSEDVWKTLLAFLVEARLACEHCNGQLAVHKVSCGSCAGELINQVDCEKQRSTLLVAAETDGLAGSTGIETCLHCKASLELPARVEKFCGRCKEVRHGLTEENCNIIITRTGDKTYTFKVDSNRIGGLEILDATLLDEVSKEVLIGFDPKTGATYTNLWNLQGTTAEQLARLCGTVAPKVTGKAPTSPLKLST